MADALQSERQLFILSLLSENKNGLTLEQILKELSYIGVDVSKRTVERDLDCVTYHFCVHEEEKNGDVYYYANKYQIENLCFTLKELIALYFSKEMLKPYLHTQEGATSIGVINKITASLPKLHKEYLESLRDLYKFNTSVTKCDKLSGNNKIDLKLKFNKAASRYIMEYELEKADIIEELPNGEITFKRKTTLTDDVVNWILSFGSKVEVLEPPELRSEIKETAKKVLEKYM
jgi:proteasome accessory factor B